VAQSCSSLPSCQSCTSYAGCVWSSTGCSTSCLDSASCVTSAATCPVAVYAGGSIYGSGVVLPPASSMPFYGAGSLGLSFGAYPQYPQGVATYPQYPQYAAPMPYVAGPLYTPNVAGPYTPLYSSANVLSVPIVSASEFSAGLGDCYKGRFVLGDDYYDANCAGANVIGGF